jgi:steroid 5-alpha reductase family enzyme
MPILIYVFVIIFGLGFAWLIGADSATWNGLPITFICALIAFAINWLAFIPAWKNKTEKYYDITGSMTYLSVVTCAIVLSGPPSLLSLIVGGIVIVWCLRLGTMLFSRIKRDGEDKRFRAIKSNPVRFLGAWTIQGLWVIITAACALAILTNQTPLQLDIFFIIGSILWLIGFGCEVVADNQKNAFRSNPDNKGRFITKGLWAWSQHPNYFGEILLWTGIGVIAVPLLQGTAWLALFSPIFVLLLLTKVSGIPMLDNLAKERWGDDEDYQSYIRRTSKLIPLPPKS